MLLQCLALPFSQKLGSGSTIRVSVVSTTVVSAVVGLGVISGSLVEVGMLEDLGRIAEVGFEPGSNSAVELGLEEA